MYYDIATCSVSFAAQRLYYAIATYSVYDSVGSLCLYSNGAASLHIVFSFIRPMTHAPLTGTIFSLEWDSGTGAILCSNIAEVNSTSSAENFSKLRGSVLLAQKHDMHRDPSFHSQGCIHRVVLRFFLFNFSTLNSYGCNTRYCNCDDSYGEFIAMFYFSAPEIFFPMHLERKTGARNRSRKTGAINRHQISGADFWRVWHAKPVPILSGTRFRRRLERRSIPSRFLAWNGDLWLVTGCCLPFCLLLGQARA